jgi:hypothetical protein
MDNHTIYAASVRQLNGIIAERDALAVALAAKSEQVAGLLAEREALRAQRDGLQTTLTAARDTLDKWRRAYYGDLPAPTVRWEVSAARDDAIDDGPDAFEDVGGAQ